MTHNIPELRSHHVTIQGQNEGQKGGRAVGWTKGGEEKLIGDHDATLANGQDHGNKQIQEQLYSTYDCSRA